MSDLPTPRFQIGQTVWMPVTEATSEQLPCPDCLGSQTWKVLTPAGTEMTTRCQRCTRDAFLRTPAAEAIPSLMVYKYLGRAHRLTVGSVRIDTADTDNPVEYMCVETGVGSGSIYYERKLFPTEEEALQVAEAEAALKTVEVTQRPDQLAARKWGNITVNFAGRMADWMSVYNAWDVARHHRETLDEIMEKGESSFHKVEDVRTFVEERASDLRRYEFIDRHPFEALLVAARNSVDPTVRAVVEQIDHKFPSGDDAADLAEERSAP